MRNNFKYRGKVLTGEKAGRTIGFPTVNLSPHLVPKTLTQGVYAARVEYKNKKYMGALYYGPRLVKNEKKAVLEIYIIDFNQEIYGEWISFDIVRFIRGIKNFDSMDLLKKQITIDIADIKKIST
ncbi:hypothetical protein A3C28_00555 [Candidatus Roizmanbacteria bacterium RIFCSPHIGHO2_02_FULL_39_9]|uniref:riboflavin kinase n=1 Tax=Candidatus Roizmanbacteria bacterium RIFCSPHIGHO2_02_FULL_39_9 TaxID=1802040 RepID=A0A1F7H431_9BACT|nr:MAG: hypothetical protein A3C28_00555 [Candidatus Roizmanbacteria bacterium RIFCSPHIGHO2_02_FULL_39_9]